MMEVSAGDVSLWFAGPNRMRTVGALYVPAQPENYYYSAYPHLELDALIYIHSTTASPLLPFIYQ